MKNKYISYFLIFLGLVIAAVIAFNYINSKPKKARENPYEYNVDEFRKVDPALIGYKEIRQIRVDMGETGGLATYNGMIYLAAKSSVKTLLPDGQLMSEFPVEEDPHCLAVDNDKVVLGYEKSFTAYSLKGEKLFQSGTINDSTVIASLAIRNGQIVVADMGKRRIWIFSQDKLVKEIEGVSGAKNLHGFVIPSPYFDVAVNSANELWAANTGMHTLQQYDENGNLVRSWEKISLQIDGFSGCCNPAHFTFLPDGRFVTSEKGLPRIKVYKPDGTLESVVAPPDKFKEDGHAAEVATLGEIVVALDYDKKMIRLFEIK